MDVITRYHGIEQVERGRDHNFTLELYQSDLLSPQGLLSGDVVRFKIWQTAAAAPQLDLDSVTLPSATLTADAGTDVITSNNHGLEDGQRVQLTSSGTLPAGLATGTVYYVRDKTTNTFKLAVTSAGSAIDITDAGTGTHTWQRVYSTLTIDALGTTDTTPAQVTLQLHRDEVDTLTAGEWNWEASVVRPTLLNRIFPFALGIFDVVANSTGDVGVT